MHMAPYPKKLELALQRYHVSNRITDFILNNFRLRATAGAGTSDWHRLEKGIITGCTISVILFDKVSRCGVQGTSNKTRATPAPYKSIWMT